MFAEFVLARYAAELSDDTSSAQRGSGHLAGCGAAALSLERLRINRTLEEALAHGGYPRASAVPGRVVDSGGLVALGTDAPLRPVGLHLHLGCGRYTDT